ncbi:MAG: 30S ribosomal protein S21 [Flavobacteriales bacterium]
MLVIKVKDGENIERALKRYKNKHRRVQITRELRARKNYVKPTTHNRFVKLKAEYINAKRLKEEI